MKWVLVSMMRRNSERLPEKLLSKIWTPIGFVSLMEWNAHRIREWAKHLECDYFLGVGPDDADRLASAGFAVFVRSQESLDGENGIDIYRDIPPKFDGYDWALHVNACCPFVELDSVQKFMAAGEKAVPLDAGAFPGFVDCGVVRTGDGTRIFPPPDATVWPNTKTDQKFITTCRSLVMMPAKCVGRQLFPMDILIPLGRRTAEHLDVDYPDDMDLVSAYAAYKWHIRDAHDRWSGRWSDYQ